MYDLAFRVYCHLDLGGRLGIFQNAFDAYDPACMTRGTLYMRAQVFFKHTKP